MVKPKICFVVTAHGTAMGFLKGYLTFLREDGWDVWLICSPGDGVEAFAEREVVGIRTIPMRRDPSPLHDLVSLFRLFRVIRGIRPNVVVYATPKASLLASVVARLAGVESRIYEMWGLRLETTKGITRTVLRFLEKATIRLSTSVVANSQSLAARIQELNLAGNGEIRVLGSGSSHGVNAERFSSAAELQALDPKTQEFLCSKEGFTIGFIGRLHPDKGIDVLLDAVKLCDLKGVPLRVLLVGGDEGARIGERVAAMPYVHLVGRVSDVRPYLKSMDALVLMSLREGFPNVVLEAAAMGVPAIVANTTGTVDSVAHGVTGLVVEAGNAFELAERIAELVTDTALHARMSIAGRERVLAEFEQHRVWKLHSNHFYEQFEQKRSE